MAWPVEADLLDRPARHDQRWSRSAFRRVLKAGEILVSPVTTPGWTPAFARALAVVTDTGSIVSHASIVAREYGIPAVVATACATRVFHDGQIVTVDGARGVVFPVS